MKAIKDIFSKRLGWAVFLLLFWAGQGFANCGSASCPIMPHSSDLSGGKRLSLDLSWQYIDQNQPMVGSHDARVGQLPENPEEVRTLNRAVTLAAGYALTRRLVLGATLPYVVRYHQHYETATDWMETWHLKSLGDIAISGRYEVLSHVSGTLALKLPTGKRDPVNTFGDVAECTLAPSTGSTDITAGIAYQNQIGVRSLSRGRLGNHSLMPYHVAFSYRRNGRGTDDYRRADEYAADFSLSYPLTRTFQVLAQVNARYHGKDDVGTTDAIRDYTGGRSVFLSPGLLVNLPGGLAAYSYFQIPAYQRVNGLQLTSKYNMYSGIQVQL
jgi:hypothetical protein